MDWTLEELAPVGGRRFLAARAKSLAVWPVEVALPSRYFACLVIADGTAESTDELGRWASRALSQGMVFCAAWGPGGEVVHDVVDWAALERDKYRSDSPIVVTTWHSSESMAEAVEFFVNTTVLDAAYRPECHSWLLVEDGEFGLASGSRNVFLDLARRDPG